LRFVKWLKPNQNLVLRQLYIPLYTFKFFCSPTYVKGVFLEQDLKKAINLSRQRFADCGEAAETLTGQKQQANLQRRSSHLLNRRGFIYLIIPAFFTFGVATPALASKGKAFGKCMSTATKASIRQDQKDGKCGNEPEIYYGLCCLGIIGLGVANEGK
jgi:hypothetical protein